MELKKMSKKMSKFKKDGEIYEVNLPGLTVTSDDLNKCSGLTDNVQDQIDACTNIEIGGRNLLAYSSLRNGDYDGTNAQIRVSVDIENRHYIEAGQVITLSSTSDELLKWLGITDENNTPIEDLIYRGSGKLYTVTATKSGYLTPIFGKYNSEGGWDIMTVDFIKSCNVKIEKGNKATDWTPAPEDMATKAENDDLKMLGWAVPGESPIQNYVDSNRVFHQRVGRVALWKLSWAYESSINRFMSQPMSDMIAIDHPDKIWCNRLFTPSQSPIQLSGVDNTICPYVDTKLYCYCFSYTDSDSFKNYLKENEVYLYYELAEEIQTSIDGNEKIVQLDKLEIGGRNYFPNSANMEFNPYGGATLNTEKNITVSEWGATDAIRVYGTSGTDRLTLYQSYIAPPVSGVSPPGVSIPGISYVNSIWVKNNHSTNIIIVDNNLGSIEIVTAGEQKRVILTDTGNGKNYVQFRFSVSAVGDAFDITYWHPQVEIGNKATDWTPALEDPCMYASIGTKDSGQVGSIWIE